MAFQVHILQISDLDSLREPVPTNLLIEAPISIEGAGGSPLAVAQAGALELGGHQGSVVDVGEPTAEIYQTD